VVFLVGYAWQALDTSLAPATRTALDVAPTGIWVLFGRFVENLRRASEQVEEAEERTRAQLARVLAELSAISARLDALERERERRAS
jgi:hypothetical protein